MVDVRAKIRDERANRRTRTLQPQMTDEEVRIVDDAVDAAGMTKHAFCRQALLEKATRVLGSAE